MIKRNYNNILEKDLPETIDQAVDMLISHFSLRKKVKIANMIRGDLISLDKSLAPYIWSKFQLWRNESLIESGHSQYGRYYLQGDDTCSVIVKELWKKLRETHKLRIVK
ncbi:MAG: hypothetical protein JSV31_06095 [Desulfobacterales bacterium]|jgi:hypothetical protein|nr:MAG: hypothetical protein JSV31_06095 [Desulfobacterales bacterium]